MQDDYYDQPFYCIAKQGNRYFWMAVENLFGYRNVNPLGYGYAETEEEAIKLATALTGNDHREMAGWALTLRSRMAKKTRTEKQAATHPKAKTAAPVEYLYTWFQSDDPGYIGSGWIGHTIVKKTAKKVYVLRSECDERCFVFDRAKLEQEGRIFERHFRESYYTEEGKRKREEEDYQRSIPVSIRALGLSWPCTVEEVKTVYRRKSKELHPDAGGEHEAFIALQRNYEQALKLFPRSA